MDTSAIFSIIALMTTINAITIGIIFHIYSDKKKLKSAVSKLRNHIDLTDKISYTLIEWIIISEKIEKYRNAIYNQNILDNCEQELKAFATLTKPLKVDKKRKKQELMLFSTSASVRESAYKQLSNSFGDLGSLHLMRELDDYKSRKSYSIYLKTLEDRINENFNYGFYRIG